MYLVNIQECLVHVGRFPMREEAIAMSDEVFRNCALHFSLLSGAGRGSMAS
jgi:hypothetical protein